MLVFRVSQLVANLNVVIGYKLFGMRKGNKRENVVVHSNETREEEHLAQNQPTMLSKYLFCFIF